MAVILVVDDDATLRDTTARLLEGEGHRCVAASGGRAALEALSGEPLDLMVLDVMMPDMDGFSVLECLRSSGSCIPVLLLTAKGDIADKKAGFRLGADDYLTKPFVAEELALRVEALLRRAGIGPATRRPGLDATVAVGDMVVDLRHGDVAVAGAKVDLTPKERRIMLALAENCGSVLSRDDIVAAVWGEEYLDSSVSVPVYIRNIREKTEPDPANPRYVQTVWGQGYRLGD